MAISFASDLSLMLADSDFGVEARYRNKSISVIFDNETIPVEGAGLVAVHQQQPRITARTADFSTIAEDQTLTIGLDEYKIKEWVHDGTGATEIRLEKV